MANTYSLLSSKVLDATSSIVTFSSIPQTFTDLTIKISARTNVSNTIDTLGIVFNGDSSSFDDSYLSGNGSTLSQGSYSGYGISISGINGSTSVANTFSNTEIYIGGYTSVLPLQCYVLSAQENNLATAYLAVDANNFSVGGPITSISFVPINGSLFAINSSFYLYGIKSS